MKPDLERKVHQVSDGDMPADVSVPIEDVAMVWDGLDDSDYSYLR